MERLEQVGTAALKALVAGHSKCTKAFYYLEFGTLMIRHKVMIRRILYHHHIITREENETIKKVYYKQKEKPCKGDWCEIIKKDFNFIGEELDEDFIKQTPKDIYSKYIKQKVQQAAFNSYIEIKEKSKTKMKNVKYLKFAIQEYLQSDIFNHEEKKLLFSLRSMCYPAKMNF